MKQELLCDNVKDGMGNPTGGFVHGIGIDIRWQDGPLGRGKERKEPSGAFVEGVIEAALQRLEFYQTSMFACSENEAAIGNLKAALRNLEDRTRRREGAGVEGLHAEEATI